MSATGESSASSVFLKTLGSYSIAILGWGLGLGALMVIVLRTFPSVVDTPEAKQALIDTAKSFNFFWEPVAVVSPGGYALWKYGPLLTFPSIWGILAGSRLLRGKEEFGSLGVKLALPRSHLRIVFVKLAALDVALLLIGLLAGILTGLGGMSINADFSFGDALYFGLDISLVAAAFAAITLFVSLFTRDRSSAAGLMGALFGLSLLLNSFHLVVPSAENLARLSPVYYFGLSKSLVPSYGTNPVAMGVLAGIVATFSLALVPVSELNRRQQQREYQQQLKARMDDLAIRNPDLRLLAEYLENLFQLSNRSNVIQNVLVAIAVSLVPVAYLYVVAIGFFQLFFPFLHF